MEDITCKSCGSVNDYNTVQRGKHLTAFCNGCSAYIKNMPQGKPATLFFGKYKDREISSLRSEEEVRYLQWLKTQEFVKPKLRADIDAHLQLM